jgi:hypothetical protein
MEPFLSNGEIAGKIICPNKKCGAKLGNYDWAGVCCGCKEWVTPVSTSSFLLSLSSFSVVATLYFLFLFRRISSVVAAFRFGLLVKFKRVCFFVGYAILLRFGLVILQRQLPSDPVP